MRIGIDARPLSKERTGVGNYVQGLVEFLPQAAPEHEYILYSNRPIEAASVQEKCFRHLIDRKFDWCPGAFWLAARGAYLALRDEVDVYWSTNTVLPIHLPAKMRKIVTVYDTVWLRCPETSTRYNVLVQTLFARRAIKHADCIVVISRSTRDELVQALGVPEEKIRLVYPGIVDRYQPIDKAEAASYIAGKYGVPQRYVATAGIVHPRKNQRFLVGVLSILKRRGQLDFPLLVAGPIGWKNSPMFQEIQAAGLANDIRLLGYIPDEDMPYFYAGAQLFLFPTLYEGFGLPPVEAMACGTPVIASNAPAMPEVLGDAAILLPLTGADAYARAILEVLGDEKLRGNMRSKGIERARSYKYATSVRQLVAVFGETRCLASPQVNQKDTVSEGTAAGEDAVSSSP